MTTTIDLKLQQQASEAIKSVLADPDGPAAALVAIDPRNGAVKAMVGGTNFRKSQFNLATQAERQPGSAFKPIVLASAFRRGISPLTRFDSKPVVIDAGDRFWRVTNYESSYAGRIDLSSAMVTSDNSVYAQLTELVGPSAIVDTAHELGVRSDLPAYFSIGLGAVAVNPLDMARAYATVANDGMRVDGALTGDRPRVIERVGSRRGDKVRVNTPVPEQVLDEGQARVLTSILQGVVRSGTGRRAAIPGVPVAGKTGTTDNYGDAWFVGYTPELVTAVWVGYPNELRPMLTEFHGRPVAGGTLPAQIWKAFTEKARESQAEPASYFASAPYLAAQDYRIVKRGGWKLDNGYCPGTRLVSFFSGLAPDEQAECFPNEVRVPLVTGLHISDARERLALQPLGVDPIGIPAKAGSRPGLVTRQEPRQGRVRVRSEQRAALGHATGSALRVVPQPDRLQPRRRPRAPAEAEGDTQRLLPPWVVRGDPHPEAGPRRRVRAADEGHARRRPLTDGRRQARHDEASLELDRLRDADPCRRLVVDRTAGSEQLERRPLHRGAVVSTGDAERLSEPAGAGAQQSLVRHPAPGPHRLQPVRRPQRSQQHGRADAIRVADDVHAPVQPVRAVHVQMTGRAEHDRVARRPAAEGVTCRVLLRVRLRLDDHAADTVDEQRPAEQRRRSLRRRQAHDLRERHSSSMKS